MSAPARLAGLAATVLAVAALSGCGGGSAKPATVQTPAGGGSPSATSPLSVPAPSPTAAPAPSGSAPSASAGGGSVPQTGAAAPGGQDDTQTLNQIDSALNNIDGSLGSADSASAQETN